ncbi:hypothetical protein, partial [Nostoc sp. DSM 114160]
MSATRLHEPRHRLHRSPSRDRCQHAVAQIQRRYRCRWPTDYSDIAIGYAYGDRVPSFRDRGPSSVVPRGQQNRNRSLLSSRSPQIVKCDCLFGRSISHPDDQ